MWVVSQIASHPTTGRLKLFTTPYYHGSDRLTTVSESSTPTVFELRTIGSHRFVIREAIVDNTSIGWELYDLTSDKRVRIVRKGIQQRYAVKQLIQSLDDAEAAHANMGVNSPFWGEAFQVVGSYDNQIALQVTNLQALKAQVDEYRLGHLFWQDDLAVLEVNTRFWNTADIAQYLGEVA